MESKTYNNPLIFKFNTFYKLQTHNPTFYVMYVPVKGMTSGMLQFIHVRMTPYANEIIGEYQCGFSTNRTTVDHIFSIRQILEKKWEYNNEVVCQLFIDFEKASDSIKREPLYNILIKFGVLKG